MDRNGRAGGRRLRWPRSRAAGCLLWIVLLVVLLIVLSVLFGGFQKGTQVRGLGAGRWGGAATGVSSEAHVTGGGGTEPMVVAT